jgi:hypothetical protein
MTNSYPYHGGDFCLIHGCEHMRSTMGNPIPWCEACEEERESHSTSNIKAEYTMSEKGKPAVKNPPWECAAQKQSTAGGNHPADCDWPCCGCDPYANKVMSALDEAGFELIKKHDVNRVAM